MGEVRENYGRNKTLKDFRKKVQVSSYDIVLIEKVKAFINSDLGIHHTTEELAVVAEMGQTRLKELFKLQVGMGLYEYLRKQRLEAAAEKLATGDMNLKTITRACGYHGYSNFAKAFKNHYGMTPRRYRQLHR